MYCVDITPRPRCPSRSTSSTRRCTDWPSAGATRRAPPPWRTCWQPSTTPPSSSTTTCTTGASGQWNFGTLLTDSTFRLPEVMAPKSTSELESVLNSSFLFTLVRHPLLRLVSAYRWGPWVEQTCERCLTRPQSFIITLIIINSQLILWHWLKSLVKKC